MTKIYLIRHAEAEGNLYRRIHGVYNSGVTARGLSQIDQLAERFRNIPIDAVYASDLCRTQTTAGAILKYHPLPLNIEPGLREVNMGCWEDLPWGNAGYYHPEQMMYFASDPALWDIPGCEKYPDLQSRITSTLLRLSLQHQGETIACFSHGMAIRSFIAGVKGISSENIHEILHGDNTCVALLNVENGSIDIEYYNDNSHLSSDLSTFANQSWWRSKNSPDLANLRFEPMDIAADEKLYCSCYRDGWQAAHGTLSGYSSAPYLSAAQKISAQEPLALMKVFSGEKFAGIVELDPSRLAEQGCGWISLLYLVPEMRGKGFGVQLLGHAVSFFRGKGRSAIRLHVAETNQNALRFYKGAGFSSVDIIQGSLSPLLLLDKKI